jgi:hypothetical protein
MSEFWFLVRTSDTALLIDDLNVNDTIAVLRERLRVFLRTQGTPFSDIGLIFAGKSLVDERSLADYNIQSGSTLFMVARSSCNCCRRFLDGGVRTIVSYAASNRLKEDVRELETHGYRDIVTNFNRGCLAVGVRLPNEQNLMWVKVCVSNEYPSEPPFGLRILNEQSTDSCLKWLL